MPCRSAKLLSSLVNQHKGMRRCLVIWAATQTHYVIHQVFEHTDRLNGFVIGALTVVVAPLVGLIVYYVKNRSDDDKSPDSIDSTKQSSSAT
jgi:hypothetical protein